MKHRYTFYWILWGLGELSGLGQWLLLRWALPVPEHELLLTFSLLPFVYLVPNILGNHLPLNVTRLLARIGGYWFIYGYYMTLLLLPAFAVWLVCLAQPFGLSLDWWHTVFSVYYGRASLLGLAALLAVGSWRARHPVMHRIEMETEKPIERAFSVAFASDIHLGAVLGHSFAAELRRDMMNLQPDLILFGGDIIDGDFGYVLRDKSFKGFAGLKAPWGVYAVFGNHDTYGMNLSKEQKRLKQNGVRCLRGGTVHLVAGVSLGRLHDCPARPVPAGRARRLHDCDGAQAAAHRAGRLARHGPLLRRSHACRTVLAQPVRDQAHLRPRLWRKALRPPARYRLQRLRRLGPPRPGAGDRAGERQANPQGLTT